MKFKQFSVDIWLNDPTAKTNYNLVANICHEGQHKGGFYKVHVRHKALDQWYWICSESY